jgi:hypothetical protein
VTGNLNEFRRMTDYKQAKTLPLNNSFSSGYRKKRP